MFRSYIHYSCSKAQLHISLPKPNLPELWIMIEFSRIRGFLQYVVKYSRTSIQYSCWYICICIYNPKWTTFISKLKIYEESPIQTKFWHERCLDISKLYFIHICKRRSCIFESNKILQYCKKRNAASVQVIWFCVVVKRLLLYCWESFQCTASSYYNLCGRGGWRLYHLQQQQSFTKRMCENINRLFHQLSIQC